MLLEALLITQALAGPAALQVGILDPEDRPLPGVSIELRGPGGRLHALTNRDGVAVLDAPPGEYRVKIVLAGFETQKVGVSVVEGRPTNLSVGLEFAKPSRGVIQFRAALKSIDVSSSTTVSNFWLHSGYSVRY